MKHIRVLVEHVDLLNTASGADHDQSRSGAGQHAKRWGLLVERDSPGHSGDVELLEGSLQLLVLSSSSRTSLGDDLFPLSALAA